MIVALQVVQFETAVGIPANCSVGKQPRRRGRINRFFIIPCIVLPVTEREPDGMGSGTRLDQFFIYLLLLFRDALPKTNPPLHFPFVVSPDCGEEDRSPN